MEEMCKTGLQQITPEQEEEQRRKNEIGIHPHEVPSTFSAVVAPIA